MRTSQADKLLKVINGAVGDFIEATPSVEASVMRSFNQLLREFDTVGDTLKVSVKNLRLVAKLRAELETAFFENAKYQSNMQKYLKSFEEVSALQSSYFATISEGFTSSALLGELERQTVDATLYGLTRGSMASNVIDPVLDILRENITTGTSYQSLSKQVTTFIKGDAKNLGHIERYVQQISTDALNQFSAQYMETVTNDLGLDWFVYDGNIIEGTRSFCRAMFNKRYYHRLEIPDMVKGKVGDVKVPIYSKTGLPQGFIAGTNKKNFNIYRGGYNCRHHPIPVPESKIPKDVRVKTYKKYNIPYDKKGYKKRGLIK